MNLIDTPFFNKPAHTTTMPAQLAVKIRLEISSSLFGKKKNNSFKMEILKPIKFNKQKMIQKKIKKIITIKINQIIEKMILKKSKQWIWTHRRWK